VRVRFRFRSTIKQAWGDPATECGELLGKHETLPGRLYVYAKTTLYPEGAVIVIHEDDLTDNHRGTNL